MPAPFLYLGHTPQDFRIRMLLRHNVPSLSALRYLPAAQTAASEERNRIEAERKAFEEFRRRVSTLPPKMTANAVTESTPQTQLEILDNSSNGIDRVRQAYRETIMSVDHYGLDYDEPLPANMAAELGADIAHAVNSGQPLATSLKRTIITASQNAAADRSEFLKELKQERAAIDEARKVLASIDTPTASVKHPLSACPLEDLGMLWDEFMRSSLTRRPTAVC